MVDTFPGVKYCAFHPSVKYGAFLQSASLDCDSPAGVMAHRWIDCRKKLGKRKMHFSADSHFYGALDLRLNLSIGLLAYVAHCNRMITCNIVCLLGNGDNYSCPHSDGNGRQIPEHVEYKYKEM